jgi:predicted PurR-regulated permease PerM
MLLGIVITYATVQFVQSYIIEPLVVGSEVNINPFFTIAGIVAGEMVWGIPGMILSIPLLGMAKIICDGVPQLQPIGFLIGTEKKKEGSNLIKKVKTWFK